MTSGRICTRPANARTVESRVVRAGPPARPDITFGRHMPCLPVLAECTSLCTISVLILTALTTLNLLARREIYFYHGGIDAREAQGAWARYSAVCDSSCATGEIAAGLSPPPQSAQIEEHQTLRALRLPHTGSSTMSSSRYCPSSFTPVTKLARPTPLP